MTLLFPYTRGKEIARMIVCPPLFRGVLQHFPYSVHITSSNLYHALSREYWVVIRALSSFMQDLVGLDHNWGYITPGYLSVLLHIYKSLSRCGEKNSSRDIFAKPVLRAK